MRVLMLSWEYPPHVVGGLGKHVAELAPALAAQGITTTVLTPLLRNGALREMLSPNLQIVRIEPPRMEDYGFVAFVEQTNRAMEHAAWALQAQVGGFDLIHAHDWLTASAAVRLKHTWRIPLIATIHATERGRGRGELNGSQSQRINHLEWELTYEAWRAIVCSGFMANQVVDHFSTPRDKIDVVPNGVQISPNPFTSAAERQAFRRRFAADDEAIAFYVGRVVYEKGLHVLLRAWPQIAAQIRARLVIAGAGSYLDDLREQAAALGISHQVYFTGFIADDDRDRLYHVADVATFPSLYEPFGIVALEAFAAGCPVVAASTGGLAEVIRNHETGITVLPDHIGSLSWGIVHSLDYPEWAHIRAANALREVQERYDWSCIAQATEQVYRCVYAEWQRSSWGKELTHGATTYVPS